MNNKRSSRARLARALWLAGVCGLAIAGAAHAQGQTQTQTAHNFNIPAENAADGLQVFARQSGKQVLFPFDAVAGRRTPAISGVMSDDDALAKLAAAAGLRVSSDDGATVTLVKADGPAAQAAADPIPEVIVTAARRAQNLQKVSSAVQVVSGAKLSAQGLSNVAQIVADMPSVQATGQPGGYSINIRGQGGDLPAGTTQGSTALEFDGVYNINSQGATVGFYDVDRIEVLPGPQSTRYGPDADGGVMNVITRDPRLNSWSGEGALTLGDYGLVRTELAQNVPLGDKAALRIAATTLSRSSYYENPTEGNVRSQSLRVKLLFRPSEDLTLKLSAQTDHIGGTGEGSNAFPVFTNKVAIYAGDSINDLSNPWTGYDNINQTRADIRQNTFTASASWSISDAVGLDVLTAYANLSGWESGCIYAPPWSVTAGGPFPICGAVMHEFAPFHQASTEIRLHNGPGSRLIWNLGVYHWDYLGAYFIDNASFFSSPPVTTTTATNAIYGEITYPLTAKLRLIGGLRKSFDDRSNTFNNSGVVTPFYKFKESHGDYRAGAEYDLSRGSMLYATVSTGYRPGGLSGFNVVTGAPNSFSAETNTAYEIGAKNRFFDNRLQLNADLFVYKQDGYQNLDKYTGFIPAEGGAPCGNGDSRAGCVAPTWNMKGHVTGFETQVRFAITPNDMLNINGTWMDARFDQAQGVCATVGISAALPGYTTADACYDAYNDQATDALKVYVVNGAVQPHSPKVSGNVAYDHTFAFASGASLTVGGSVFYTTGYWLNPVEDDARYGWQPGYWLENATATFTPARGDWTLNAYVHNIADYAVKMSVLPATSLGDPRTFGLVLSKRW